MAETETEAETEAEVFIVRLVVVSFLGTQYENDTKYRKVDIKIHMSVRV